MSSIKPAFTDTSVRFHLHESKCYGFPDVRRVDDVEYSEIQNLPLYPLENHQKPWSFVQHTPIQFYIKPAGLWVVYCHEIIPESSSGPPDEGYVGPYLMSTENQPYCHRCGANTITCHRTYYTTGGDMEHVEWKHTCGSCEAVAREIQQGCYGYDNTYQCPFPFCTESYP